MELYPVYYGQNSGRNRTEVEFDVEVIKKTRMPIGLLIFSPVSRGIAVGAGRPPVRCPRNVVQGGSIWGQARPFANR